MENKTAWEKYKAKDLKELERVNEGYKKFLDDGKTERECVKQTIAMAKAAGYTAVVRPAPTWRAFLRQRMRWAGKAPHYTDPDILRCGALIVAANLLQLLCPLDKLDVCTVLATDLGEMDAVCAVPAADDDHRVAGCRNSCRFLLPRKRSKAYCIRYFCICTSFFYDFTTFVKIIAGLRGLHHHCYRFFPKSGIFFQKSLHFRGIFKDLVLSAPAADGLHLRVLPHADDEHEAPLF